MLVIGAWGISYVRASIALGSVTPIVLIGFPFLVASAFFVTRGLGKRPPRPKWFWPGVILLCLGLLLVFQMQVTLHVLYRVILSVPLFGGGVFCVVWGMRRQIES
jgi:hypothetical protein